MVKDSWKLSGQQKLEVMHMYDKGEKLEVIARRFSITDGSIRALARRHNKRPRKPEQLNIDWTNGDKVIALAQRLGPGQTVYKDPDKVNYNICATNEEKRLIGTKALVVFRTK